ncbi:lipoprotein [Hymenobacter sp. BT683]|uniref:Type IV secretion system putative lipoprotein virB7 n=1 Tax=Hymenobacter jeongseonensis TaxID=2791027 RepID=A0ABS0IMF8_9BACT|nr:lipoprotein [Hymenobacter jeongseonensis]MBF9239526.1 lipoprotein [Hymenobacter jeongseonensis]
MRKIFILLLAILTLAGCNNKHPETIYGIKLGYPAESEINKAIKEGDLVPSEAGNIMTLSNSAKGSVFYNTYTDTEGEKMLESVNIKFYTKGLFSLRAGEGVHYLNFKVNEEDKNFIVDSYFKKYGAIAKEELKSDASYSDETEGRYYTVNINEGESVYSYYWIEKNRVINLTIFNDMCDANYYFRSEYSKELHSTIDKTLNDKRQDF